VPCQRDLAKAVREDREENPHLYTAAAVAAATAAAAASAQRASSKGSSKSSNSSSKSKSKSAARPAAAAVAVLAAQKAKARKDTSGSSSDDGESDANSAKGARKRPRNGSDSDKKHGRRRGGSGEPLDTTGWLHQTLAYCLRCDNSDDPQLECAGCPRSYHNSAFCHTAASAAVAAGGTAATNSPNWLCRYCCKGKDGSLPPPSFSVSAALSLYNSSLCVLIVKFSTLVRVYVCTDCK
jgi:hypothetical protein